jgi:hypothetical protein
MRFANAVKAAAVLTVGLIVGGCAVRVRPAAVVVDPIPMPSVVVSRPVVDVHVSRPVVVNQRPIIVEKKTVVVNPKPVVIKKETTVVVDKNKGNNGNHYGQNKDKKDDKKGGVAKND